MENQLIGVIASYWGARCTYESLKFKYYHSQPDEWFTCKQYIKSNVLESLEFKNDGVRNLKIHLRKPYSIKKRELSKMMKSIGFKLASFSINKRHRDTRKIAWIHNGMYGFVFWIEKSGRIVFDNAQLFDQVNFINALKSSGFCVDEILIKNKLVEWIN